MVIATAANMQFAMKELAARFTEQSGIDCDLVISSSGKLTAQIREGAPFDVFVAANMKYPQEVFASGLAAGAPRVYAHGQLVLWSTAAGITPDLSLLTSSAIRHIAVANPKTAPYGEAALQVLDQAELLEKVRHKLVYGESIAQTNQFITTGAAEVGFTAKSVVLSLELKNMGAWAGLDETLYSPIAQGAIVLDRARQDEAGKFLEFLFSAEAAQVLESLGYHVPQIGSGSN